MLSKTITDYFIHSIYPRLDGTSRMAGQALPAHYALKPYHQSKRIGWSHFGVMIPDLPAPHHFYSLMSIIGTPGALAFDTDHMLKDQPRQSATAVFGTDANDAHQFSSYSIPQDCQFAADGSFLRFADDVLIQGAYPHYHYVSKSKKYVLEIDISVTDKVSWFVKTPFYDHISLLAQYQGRLSDGEHHIDISGLCTFEHAACVSPYQLLHRPLKQSLKLPVDFFTYQIINLDESTQLLLNDTRVNGTSIVTQAYLRGLNQYSTSYVAVFKVLEYQSTLAISPDGNSMRLPYTFQWLIYKDNQLFITLQCQVDTDFHYGLGSGYVGGYRYIGSYQDRDIQGRGYIEYIDRRI